MIQLENTTVHCLSLFNTQDDFDALQILMVLVKLETKLFTLEIVIQNRYNREFVVSKFAQNILLTTEIHSQLRLKMNGFPA